MAGVVDRMFIERFCNVGIDLLLLLDPIVGTKNYKCVRHEW
jgi:hypothetical protein